VPKTADVDEFTHQEVLYWKQGFFLNAKYKKSLYI